MNKSIYLPLVAIILQGCTAATQPKINKLTPNTPQVSSTLQEQYNGLKRVVAIGRFSDETKRSNGLFVDNNNNRLGKQTSDILASRLVDSGKFILVERADIHSIDQENKLSKNTSKTIGANYIVLGSVSEFGRETKSEVGVFSRNKIQQARAVVNIRLVDVNTSEVIYSEEATGIATAEANRVFGVGDAAAYNTALDDKAISAAISKLIANVMNNLMDQPWRTFIISQSDGSYVLAGGASQGLSQGKELNVYEPGKKVTNPQNGKLIELPGKTVARLQVLQTTGSGDNEVSFANLVSGQLNPEKLNTYRIVEL